MAVQLCLYEGLAARDPSPNASASPSPTTTRCSGCADPALWGQMALGFRGSLNQRATGMLSRRSPASARRCVPRSGRAASHSAAVKQSPRTRPLRAAEAETRALRTGSTARPEARSRFSLLGGGSGPLPCLAAAWATSQAYKRLTGQDWKACEARSELCREDAEPPRSTPSASDPSPSRRGPKGCRSCRGGSWRGALGNLFG